LSEENKALLRRWFDEAWNARRADVIDEMFSLETAAHGLGSSPLLGPEGFKPFHEMFLGAFPDLRVTVEEVIAEGDLTAARLSVTGTHEGDHLGVAPTGRRVSFTGMTFTRWRDGKIVEGWNNVDIPGLMKQIGAG
jgi:predicted ester cyclase